MNHFDDPEANFVFEKLQRFGTARNRWDDHEVRTVTFTDDECLILWSSVIDLLAKAS